MKMDLASRNVESLRKDASTAGFEPTCSRDGRYCAFVRQRGVLSLSLAILDRQSNALVEMMPPSGFTGMRSPANFCRQLSRLVFVCQRRTATDLFNEPSGHGFDETDG